MHSIKNLTLYRPKWNSVKTIIVKSMIWLSIRRAIRTEDLNDGGVFFRAEYVGTALELFFEAC